MSADFGAEIEAALSAHLSALQAAADAARERIDGGVDSLAASVQIAPSSNGVSALPDFDDLDDLPDVVQPSPMHFEDAVRSPGPAVSFDLGDDLAEMPVDDEGIPFPEES